MPAAYQPLSVRTGQREPLPYHEGVPSHLKDPLIEVIRNELTRDSQLAQNMVLELQIEPYYSMSDAVLRHCRRGEGLLDVLDYLLAAQTVHGLDLRMASVAVGNISHQLDLGRSVWGVVIDSVPAEDLAAVPVASRADNGAPQFQAGLRRRVPEPAEQAYLSALGIGGASEGHLMTAWHAAYGRPSDPTTAWQYAVKAVEAALQPIVEPTNTTARLGAMRAKILQGPGNFSCQLPLWDRSDAASAVEAFTQGLSRVIYEKGHHGADSEQATDAQAQAVLSQAVTLCEWLRIGVFTRAPQDQQTSPGQQA